MLNLENVTRTFNKDAFLAVDSVNLNVESGTIHALLGPNGAGKTTLVRMCSTLLLPTSGKIFVDGIDVIRSPRKARTKIGLSLGGDTGFYPRASGLKNMFFFADLAGVPSKQRKQFVQTALEAVDLQDRATDKVSSYSRGMLQRLHLARAIVNQPKVLILDEPTNGLDPEIALQIRTLIKNLANTGTTILLTSHLLSEVEDLSDQISLLGSGRIHLTSTAQDIAKYAKIEKVTSFSLTKNTEIIRDSLLSLQSDTSRIEIEQKSGLWRVVIYWSKDSVIGEESVKNIFINLQTDLPVDYFTRPPLLEESYLAIADSLARNI